MSPREERQIRNEAIFREINLHVQELERRVGARRQSLPLVCECAEVGCARPIEVETSVFERVRRTPLRFIVAPGHEHPELESVVERHVDYLIVEKHDRAD